MGERGRVDRQASATVSKELPSPRAVRAAGRPALQALKPRSKAPAFRAPAPKAPERPSIRPPAPPPDRPHGAAPPARVRMVERRASRPPQHEGAPLVWTSAPAPQSSEHLSPVQPPPAPSRAVERHAPLPPQHGGNLYAKMKAPAAARHALPPPPPQHRAAPARALLSPPSPPQHEGAPLVWSAPRPSRSARGEHRPRAQGQARSRRDEKTRARPARVPRARRSFRHEVEIRIRIRLVPQRIVPPTRFRRLQSRSLP